MSLNLMIIQIVQEKSNNSRKNNNKHISHYIIQYKSISKIMSIEKFKSLAQV